MQGQPGAQIFLHALQEMTRSLARFFETVLLISSKNTILMLITVNRRLKNAFEIVRLPDDIQRIKRNNDAFQSLLKKPVSRQRPDLFPKRQMIFKKRIQVSRFGCDFRSLRQFSQLG